MARVVYGSARIKVPISLFAVTIALFIPREIVSGRFLYTQGAIVPPYLSENIKDSTIIQCDGEEAKLCTRSEIAFTQSFYPTPPLKRVSKGLGLIRNVG